MLTVLTSCMSTQQGTQKVNIKVPDPIVNGESVLEYNEKTQKVEVPFWYWKQITSYIIDTQELLE